MPGSICTVCSQQKDCRPYGAGGTMICFQCMKASPAREKEARAQVTQLFEKIDAAGGVPVIDGKSAVRALEPKDLLDDAAPVVAFTRRGGSR